MTTIRRAPVVAVVDRSSSDDAPSSLRVHRLVGSRWSPIGPAITVARGSQFVLLDGLQKPCVAVSTTSSVSVRCATSMKRSATWRRDGSAVFPVGQDARQRFAGAFASDGRIYVLKAESPGGALNGEKGRRLVHSTLTQRSGSWRTVGGRDIDKTAPLGTQRPSGFTLRGHPCLAYDRITDNARVGPSVGLSCLRDRRWTPQDVPSLDKATVSALQATDPAASAGINIDSATSSASGEPVVGVDHLKPASSTWPIFVLHRGQWQNLDLGAGPGGWDSQGTVYRLDRELWAVRFDQRPVDSGLRTQLVVRKLGESGESAQIGSPLIEDTPLLGPIYWDLARANRTTFAMATVPNIAERRNDVRVFRLDDEQ